MCSPTAVPRPPGSCAGGDAWVGWLRGRREWGGCWAVAGAERRAESPSNPHQAPPALPGNTVALGLGSQEGSALPLPVMRGLGKARADRRIAEAAEAVLGTLLLGQREVEQRGWVTFQEPDNGSAKAIVQLVFFYGVEGRGVCVCTEHYSRRSGVIQNDAEVRDQARAEDVRNG